MKNLTYKKYTETDFELYFDMVQDDDVMHYIFGRGMTREEARKKFDSILELNKEENVGYYLVTDQELGKHIGDCKLVNYKRNPEQFEIGYLLKKEFWRQGYGSTICEYLLNEAKENNSTREVIAIIDPQNVASKTLLTKFNFETYWVGVEDDLETEKLKLKQ